MKKICLILSIIIVFASCKKLEDLNKNTKDPSKVSGESLFTAAQKRFFDQMVTTDVNFNIWRLIDQYWNETTYEDESNYNLVNRSIPDNHWNAIYMHVLKNLDEAKKVIVSTSYVDDASPKIKTNKLAIVDVMSVHAWSVLVETFGDIPYSKALDINNLAPKYNDGLTIYKDLINRLNADITNMDPSWGSFDAADNIYQGNVTNWIKYANSLRLRMGMLLSDVDPAFAKTTVEASAADFSKLIQDNSENAMLQYVQSPPNTNPMYEDQVANGRHDFIGAVTLIDTLNNWSDPRRQYYFTQVDTSTTGTPKMAYVGAQIGIQGFYTYFSNATPAMWLPTYPGMIFDYAEVEFLLAEAVERSYTIAGGTAAAHYDNGITASMKFWGVADTAIASYLALPNIAYNTAPGTYKQKIGMQQWIAYYNRGFEGWTEQRKMDYPNLIPGVNALPPDHFPERFTYPIEEQTLNGTNYQAASAAIKLTSITPFGDDIRTKLFWDKY